MNFPTWRL